MAALAASMGDFSGSPHARSTRSVQCRSLRWPCARSMHPPPSRRRAGPGGDPRGWCAKTWGEECRPRWRGRRTWRGPLPPTARRWPSRRRLQQTLESSLNLLADQVMREQPREEHRRRLLLAIAAVHGHRHEAFDEVMLIQRLLHPVEDATRLLDVARAEIFLNHRRHRALVRDDDIRARRRERLGRHQLIRLLRAVVVGIAGVEDVDGVRGVQDVRLDAILTLRETNARRDVAVGAGQRRASDVGGEGRRGARGATRDAREKDETERTDASRCVAATTRDFIVAGMRGGVPRARGSRPARV